MTITREQFMDKLKSSSFAIENQIQMDTPKKGVKSKKGKGKTETHSNNQVTGSRVEIEPENNNLIFSPQFF